ncbi:DDE superfamily endonuclease [Popillia japonica]|uniref:DDE superfamily endonuclease n=1 Tax=Popillia japonica TaxID=7064 RepID=A0AAW1HRT8_POPJA
MAPGRKTSKELFTLLNADRSNKMQILVIGKAKRPRAFLNQELPVEYKPTRNAWMTTKIFKEFVRQKCWNKLTLTTEWTHDDLLPLAELKKLMEKEKEGLQTVYEMVQDISHTDKPTEAEVSNWLNIGGSFVLMEDEDTIEMSEDGNDEDAELFYHFELLIKQWQ